MMNKLLIYLILGIGIAIVVYYYSLNYPVTKKIKQSETETSLRERIVEIFSYGFLPGTLRIKAGESVTFINKDSLEHWPASDIHPTHNLYPESGGCIGSKFDACRGLKPGESWSFTFNKKGTWEYHDHLHSNLRGTIIVE